MATQPIEHTGYTHAQPQTRKHRNGVDFLLGSEQSKNRQDMPGETACTACDSLASLVREVSGDGEPLSFSDIISYRDGLERTWDREVRTDLFALGVDLSVPFRLVHDPVSGSVSASGDHPDKLKIDQYFISEQQQADDFKKRLSLDKLVDAAKRNLSSEDMNQPLDEEAMVSWFQNHMDTATLFSGGGIVFGRGQSAYRGLDMRV